MPSKCWKITLLLFVGTLVYISKMGVFNVKNKRMITLLGVEMSQELCVNIFLAGAFIGGIVTIIILWFS